MYAALWRLLPGPLWIRVSLAVLIAAGLVALLALVIYPWVAAVLAGNIGTTVQ